MFSIIRCCLGLVLLLFIILSARKVVNKRRYMVVGIVITLILIQVLGMLPVENAFVSFSSPNSAFKYMYGEEASLVVDGENSSLVLSIKDSVEGTVSILPKSDSGWKLGNLFNQRIVYSDIAEGFPIHVYQHNNSGDLYLSIQSTDGKIDVTESNGSRLMNIKILEYEGEEWYTYYAYIGKSYNEYSVTIEGELYHLSW